MASLAGTRSASSEFFLLMEVEEWGGGLTEEDERKYDKRENVSRMIGNKKKKKLNRSELEIKVSLI